MPGQEVRRWADEAQYAAAPMQAQSAGGRGEIIPTVRLLFATPNPLKAIGAMARMYEGKPTYSPEDVSDEDAQHYFEQVQKTHLTAPLEAVKLHFFIEGVTRSFTHQLVRQRTAVYAQESLRFAVKENIIDEVALPPSLAGTVPSLPQEAMYPSANQAQRWRERWDGCVATIQDTYEYLVNDGMPSEDARGLLPHAITTRANYVTDLRNLVDHAGNRLCTQAQFEWRAVFLGIITALANYRTFGEGVKMDGVWQNVALNDGWQFQAIATSGLFKPVCFQLGHCPFQASFDRGCTIRDRVEANAAHGIPSSEWHIGHAEGRTDGRSWAISPIKTEEWLADPTAARTTSGGGGH